MNKYDWKEIQKFYDSGKSGREVVEKFGVCWATIMKAKKRGDLKLRNRGDAIKLEIQKNPRKHTKETREKLSKIRIKYLKENPDKVPYKLNHYSKGDSYPEQYFKDLFEKENIPLKYHLQVGLYELDFYNEEYKIDVEIDGEQHYLDERIVESDVRRTNFLLANGWKVYRIRWSSFKKLSFDDKKKIIGEINSLLTK